MIYSDQNILSAIEAGEIEIDPLKKGAIDVNSVDLHLSSHYATYGHHLLDAGVENHLMRFAMVTGKLRLVPNELYLFTTEERIKTKRAVPYIDGKSSVARLGINITCTSSFGNIGFDGHFVLEVFVLRPVMVYAGMPIAKLLFFEPMSAPQGKYESDYQKQGILPVGSLLHKNKFFKHLQ